MINYRVGTAADSNAIAQLHAASWRDAYKGMLSDVYLQETVLVERQAVWAARFAEPRPDQYVMVAEQDERCVGFVCLFGRNDLQWGSLLDNLHISPVSKGQGLGTALMREAAAWLINDLQDPRMYLIVFEANEGACRFYERLGGHAVETLQQPMPDGVLVPSVRYGWEDVGVFL